MGWLGYTAGGLAVGLLFAFLLRFSGDASARDRLLEKRQPALDIWEKEFPGQAAFVLEVLSAFGESFLIEPHLADRLRPDDVIEDIYALGVGKYADAMEYEDFALFLDQYPGALAALKALDRPQVKDILQVCSDPEGVA